MEWSQMEASDRHEREGREKLRTLIVVIAVLVAASIFVTGEWLVAGGQGQEKSIAIMGVPSISGDGHEISISITLRNMGSKPVEIRGASLTVGGTEYRASFISVHVIDPGATIALVMRLGAQPVLVKGETYRGVIFTDCGDTSFVAKCT